MIDVYQHEPRRAIFVIDSKSFYASVECVARNKHPLQTMLVVMSQQENTNGGLVLAASPLAKKVLGISNVTRRRDVPYHPDLLIAEPRMNYYIQKNQEINDIYRQFVADEDLHIYSIDESILDITDSYQYIISKFGNGHNLTLQQIARIIQKKVKQKTGIYTSVGIGDNPAMAKLALDLTAKHAHSLIGEWHYETIPQFLWPIENLSDVWHIGSRTAKKLNRLGIFSMRDLALHNPYHLIEKFGVIGSELYALAWGIDRSLVRKKYHAKSRSLSNSQVLPRDYDNPTEIAVIIREIGEQIASRLRSKNLVANQISLGLGVGYHNPINSQGFHAQVTITPTNLNYPITQALHQLFIAHYQGEVIRHIAVSADGLEPAGDEQLDLFVSPDDLMQQHQLDTTIDVIRKKFGIDAIFKSSSLAGGTMLDRVGLVGGHNGGNAYG